MYLGEKAGKFFPQKTPEREKVLEWLFWQVGGLGPMAGQVSHFVNYAPNFPGDHSYSEERYKNEYDRLLGVMDRILNEREYLAGDYSIADRQWNNHQLDTLAHSEFYPLHQAIYRIHFYIFLLSTNDLQENLVRS